MVEHDAVHKKSGVSRTPPKISEGEDQSAFTRWVLPSPVVMEIVRT